MGHDGPFLSMFLSQKPYISRALSRLELLNGSESIEGLLVGRECDFDSDRGLSQLVLGGVNHTAQKFSADWQAGSKMALLCTALSLCVSKWTINQLERMSTRASTNRMTPVDVSRLSSEPTALHHLWENGAITMKMEERTSGWIPFLSTTSPPWNKQVEFH